MIESDDAFFCTTLLDWFAMNKRTFPWRVGKITPFVSLVTELLLQRTKAETVGKFFSVILDKYATPEKVLATREEEIIEDLSILGLQKRRARSLIMLSNDIMEQGGKVPSQEEDLLALQGVGKYIANAVLCFSFGKPASIVDGNVTRVLCRFFGLENKGDNRRNKHLWEKSSAIIACCPEKTKDINWAILDFAALVCVPRNPPCGECVFRQRCHHHALQVNHSSS